MAGKLYHTLATLVLGFELGRIELGGLEVSFASELTALEKIRGPKARSLPCLFLDICFHNIYCIALIVICKYILYNYRYLLSVKRLRKQKGGVLVSGNKVIYR